MIAAIQDAYVRNLTFRPSNSRDRVIIVAAKRHFGTWEGAIAAAGLSCKLPSLRRGEIWTRQKVLDAIRARHEQAAGIYDCSWA